MGELKDSSGVKSRKWRLTGQVVRLMGFMTLSFMLTSLLIPHVTDACVALGLTGAVWAWFVVGMVLATLFGAVAPYQMVNVIETAVYAWFKVKKNGHGE